LATGKRHRKLSRTYGRIQEEGEERIDQKKKAEMEIVEDNQRR
jgi:hypothetical protein